MTNFPHWLWEEVFHFADKTNNWSGFNSCNFVFLSSFYLLFFLVLLSMLGLYASELILL